MDTSKEYILMCKKAEEIQKLRGKELWQIGDFYTDDVLQRDIPGKEFYYEVHNSYSDEPYTMYHTIWLPRQDQLQALLPARFSNREPIVLIDKFHTFCSPEKFVGVMPHPIDQRLVAKMTNYLLKLRSWEQLWLAFVMKENYGKEWNGEDWK